MLIAEGFGFEYSITCNAHNTGTTIQVTPCRSAVYVAGNIAHEAMHHKVPGSGSLLEEYKAFLVGDVVRNELIVAGYGTSADTALSLTAYTVNLSNPNENQLAHDLILWFIDNRLRKYVDPKPKGWEVPALP